MKIFRWVQLMDLNPMSGRTFVSLVDVTKEKSGFITIHGNVVLDGEFYRVLAGKKTIEEPLSFKDAKEAIEKKLFDDGVIEDGDIVEDTTE